MPGPDQPKSAVTNSIPTSLDHFLCEGGKQRPHGHVTGPVFFADDSPRQLGAEVAAKVTESPGAVLTITDC